MSGFTYSLMNSYGYFETDYVVLCYSNNAKGYNRITIYDDIRGMCYHYFNRKNFML